MALKDCIKKLGKAVSAADRKLLEQWTDQGLSDDEVLQRYELHIDKTLVDITKRAQDKGATVALERDVLGEVRSFGEARVERAKLRLAKVRATHQGINQRYGEIAWTEGTIKHWEKGGPSIDLYDDGQLLTRLHQMMFIHKDLFKTDGLGYDAGSLKGKDAYELRDNLRAMQAKADELRLKLHELFLEEVALVNELEDLTGPDAGVLDEKGEYVTGPTKPEPVKELEGVYASTAPWKMKTGKDAEGDLYISRHGARAGTPHKTRQGPNDIAITFDQKVLLPDYAFYLLQYLQPQIAARAHGTAQQAVNKRDIEQVMVNHFRNQVREDSGTVYTEGEVSQENRIEEAVANYKAIVRVEEEGTIATGITKVKSAADAAHVLAEIRRNASEGFWALVLDKDDNVVGVVEHGRGTIDGTSVYPSTYAGAVLTIPGAAKVWMAHNHPSGIISPSQADQRITDRLSKLMDGSGVEVQGHVLMGASQSEFTLMDQQGNTAQGNVPITPAARNKQVKVFTRKLRGRQQGEAVRSPADTENVLKRMGNPDGVLLLNNRHMVLGFMAMDPSEMAQLKHTGGSGRLLKAFSEMNAAAFIVSTKDESPGAAVNMASFAQAGDVRMLDALYLENGRTVSMASQGRVSAQDTFFQNLALGFRSGLLTGAQTMPQKKGPADQMLNLLKKQPGVTQAEIDWLDLEDWMAAKGGTITRQEIIDYVRYNGIIIEEVQAADELAYSGQSLPNGGKPRDIFLKMPEVPEDTLIYNFEIRQDGIMENRLDDNMADDLMLLVEEEAQLIGVDLGRETDESGQIKVTAENVTESQYDLILTQLNAMGMQIIDEQTVDFRVAKDVRTGPGLKQNFAFSHFQHRNILAWMRTTERAGPNGERILMVEEIQSDWHQRGKREGYLGEIDFNTLEAKTVTDAAGVEYFEVYSGDKFITNVIGLVDTPDMAVKEAKRRLLDPYDKRSTSISEMVPDAPFKGRGWPKLAMKRIIRLAAEEGYDQVAWTTGEQQNTRAARVADAPQFVNFYDKELKNITNQAARKLDKKANVRPLGQRIQVQDGAPFTHELRRATGLRSTSGVGWYVVDYHGRQVRGPFEEEAMAKGMADQDNAKQVNIHVLDITDQMRAAALEGQTLFQNKRGAISFDQARRGIIKLTESRDLSTFMHEAGHLYLEIIGGLAEEDTTPQAVKDDYQKILEFLGAGSRSEITREQHELWAESFEKYLHEGNAPSVALQSAFNAFRRWLTEIWKRIKGDTPDGLALTPEIRDVMDRMLASDDQIAVANQRQEFAAIFQTAEQMGVSQRVFDVYKQNILKANNDAIEKETARLMEASGREARVEWRNEKAKVRAQVEAEAWEKQIYQAFWLLAKGTKPDGTPTEIAPFKIDKQSLLDLLQGSKDTLARLPKPWVYSVKNGVDVDVAARALGYNAGTDLVKALLEMPNMKDWIEVTTTERMNKLYPDPLLDGSVSENAIKAVHNERRAAILAAEMRELRRLMKEDREIVSATKKDIKTQATASREANRGTLPKREELALIKAGARRTIGAMRVMDVQPHVYLNAERRAGRLAFEAAARGDHEKAYNFKRQQIVNHEMYRAAVKAKDNALKTRNYLGKFSKPRVQQRLGKLGVIEPILAILEGVELAKKSLKQVNIDRALKGLVDAVESGQIVVTPGTLEKIMDPSINWQELTIEELEGLKDIIKQLEFQAKKKLEMPVNGEMIDMDAAAIELTENILENGEIVDIGVAENTKRARRGKQFKSGIGHWLSPSVMANLLDNQGWGAVTRLMIVPIRRAITERLIPMQQKAVSDMHDIYRHFFTNSELRQLPKKGYATLNGETLSHSDVLSLALNMGNEGNRQALFNGVRIDGKIAYPEDEVNAVLAQLTAKDWAFVQATWDYLDTYWPALAESQRERRGIAPEKVEHVPFVVETSDGETVTMKGGYYPLKYNQEHSERHEEAVFEDHFSSMGNGVYVSANTRAGATHNRVKNHGMVVNLGLHIIDRHLKELTRDIAIGNEVNFVKNLINDKNFRNAMKITGNGTMLKELNLWLTDSAVGELPANNSMERWMAYARVGFTKSKLGYNLYTAALQLTGYAQTLAVVGVEAMTYGAGMIARNPVSAWKHAFEVSSFLRVRYDKKHLAFDKDIHDAAGVLREYGTGLPTIERAVWEAFGRSLFWPIAKMQQMVDVTTWYAGYWKGRNKKGLSDEDAVHYADSQVELAQTSGFFSDRSGIERGTLSATTRQNQFIRLWTTLISYMARKGNIGYMKTKELQKDLSVANATKYAIDMLLLFTLEGMASAWIYGRWPDEDDRDPEEMMMMALKETALSVMAGVPFIREIPSAAYGGGNTPIGALSKDLFTLYIQSVQGEMDPALRKAFINSFGTIFHLPASQANRLLEALIDEDDPEILEYFTGTRD